MPNYIFNGTGDSDGVHEVHEDSCTHGPAYTNRVNLGWYSDCRAAVSAARSTRPTYIFDGCKHCCPSCHTR